jgi:hypothetical protein
MTNKIFRWFILMALFIWFLTQDACAQKKQMTGKVLRYAGTAIVLGSILTMKSKAGNAPYFGAAVVGAGFAIDIKNLQNKKHRK